MNSNVTNKVLKSLARLLEENRAGIIEANREDLAACPADDAVIADRLKVSDAKVDGMIASLETLAVEGDPSGDVISTHMREDGMRIENRRVPFGTVLIIYEARPDVSVEAAAIALKGGNRILLKGGKEARRTNIYLTNLWLKALLENGVSKNLVRYLDISREETRHLICGSGEKVDLVIPRGGEALIEFVLANSKAPVIVSGRGNNFLYIDAEADFEMAVRIAVNGKQRLSVCNALDKILISQTLPNLHENIARLVETLREAGVEVLGDRDIHEIDPSVPTVDQEDIWFEEFLAAKIVLGTVPDIAEAIAKINRFSGGHSASIITKNDEKAEQFLNEVDCAAVYHNASTRFTDGGQLGLGAEIAISTQKLHFRGPLGARHLMTNKWFIYGDGHTRD